MRAALAALFLLVAVSAAAEPPPPSDSCPPPLPNSNVFIMYNGPESGCSLFGGNCATAEPMAFNVGTFGYSLACMPFTIAWNFGDGGTANGLNVTHTYAYPGTYPVTATMNTPRGTVILDTLVAVAAPVPATSTPTLLLLALALAAIGILRVHRLV
jgi:hypothetical protein